MRRIWCRSILRTAGAAAVVTAVMAAAAPGEGVAQTVAERPQIVQETDIDRQTRALASQLRCVVCQGLSIEDSPSQLAQEMRAVIREQLEAGSTPAQVRQYFVDKYCEWVLLQPEPKGFNLVVYVLPVLMLLGGGVFVYRTARRMTRAGVGDGEETDAAVPPVGGAV
jgi:cytochrome c-type biogenesis protein CcmH